MARPLALCSTASSRDHVTLLATGSQYRGLAESEGLATRELYSVGSRAFLRSVAAGRPVFPFDALLRYVEDDLKAIEEFGPDLVVGDFRISLAVSARLAGVRYIALSNAYWSRYADLPWEAPVHTLSRTLGPGVASAVFRGIRPIIFALHGLPMHRLRKRYGQRALGWDLRDVFTEADLTLFADPPELGPSLPAGLGDRFRFIGPIHWSPKVDLPGSLAEDAAQAKPLVYVTMGSSGDARLLERILEGLARVECRVAVATAGAKVNVTSIRGAVVAEFLPGSEVTARAAMVVCNGGSMTCQEALRHGVPVLAIPANLDQLLNVAHLRKTGAIFSVRPESLTAATVTRLSREILHGSKAKDAAASVAPVFRRYNAGELFLDAVS